MKEIVIKIDDGIYKLIMSMDKALATTAIRPRIFDAIRNGKVLPKGHGDLVDRKELKKKVYTTTEWNGDVHRIIYEASVDDAPPIIEADKESGNDV